MSANLETLLANMRRAITDRTDTKIGGGVFSPAEMRLCRAEILGMQERQIRMQVVIDYLLSDNTKTMHDAIQLAKHAGETE